MSRKTLFIEFFIVSAVTAVLNFFANQHNWYWTNKNFDSFMHFLGGALVALFFLWLYYYSGWFAPEKRNLVNFFVTAMLGVTAVAVLWEIYELLLGEAKYNAVEYRLDTTLDFIMDFLGGLTACLYGYLLEIKSKLRN